MSKNRKVNNQNAYSDQKDVIISQLKAEIFEFRQRERDYFSLASHLKNLEKKYALLQEEKYMREVEFNAMNQNHFKQIAALKLEVDQMKTGITKINIEYQDLMADNTALAEIGDQKGKEIQRIKNEIEDLARNLTILKEDDKELISHITSAKSEKKKLLYQLDNLKSELDHLSRRNEDLEKSVAKIKQEKDELEVDNRQITPSIENLGIENDDRDQNLYRIDRELEELQNQVDEVKSNIKNMERANDDLLVKSLNENKNLQTEISKNMDLNARLSSAENTLRKRNQEYEDLKKSLAELRTVRTQAIDDNFQYTKLLEDLKHQVSTVTKLNSECLEELERFNVDDETVRSILNRSNRINDFKSSMKAPLKTSFLSSPKRSILSPNRSMISPRGQKSVAFSTTRSPTRY